MKKMILLLAVLMLLVMTAVSASAAVDYTVIKPSGFDSSTHKFPVVYVMPEDGYNNSKTNPMAVKLQEAMNAGDGMGMLLVMPSFAQGDDILEEMTWLVNEIDNVAYAGKTITDAKFRAVAGVDVGGYLAYATMLNASGAVAENPQLFGFVASVRGRFAAEGNPWYAKYGSIYSKLNTAGKTVAAKYFTYMDTPVDDPMANADGSTNDLGAMFISFGTAATAHEYTARPGSYNGEFVKESAKRIADRFTNYMMVETLSMNSSVSSVLVTSADNTANVSYSVMPLGAWYQGTFEKFVPSGTVPATIKVAVVDLDTGKELASKTASANLKTWGTAEGSVVLPNVTNGKTCGIKLTVKVFGATFEAASSNMVCIEDPIFNGETQRIDLMGNWYFNFTGTGSGSVLNAANLTAADCASWDVVTPCLGWWAEGFGNLTHSQAPGNAYYVREFDLPAQFTTQNPMISIGKVDDRVEVFINGKRVGGLGIDADGSINSERDTWSQYNCFAIDPSILNYGGSNTIVVRMWNNDGGGGWYEGPVAIGSESAFSGGGSYTDRFYEETYYSAAIGKDMQYLVYLPKGYNNSDKYYPTMYLLHQFSSSHTSYMIDGVNELLDKAIADGILDEMIVVIPNSDPNSWWKGKWETMVINDLMPHIDANYRTIQDARYRFTAGCSMGGQGAASMALRNPAQFSGFAAFYGAFSYGDFMGAGNPVTIVKSKGAEYVDYFSTAYICGNQDGYKFGSSNIQLHQWMEENGIEHYFLIENGGHEGAFYLPRFIDTLDFVQSKMMTENDEMKQGLNVKKMVTANIEMTHGGLALVVAADEKLADYYNEIPGKDKAEALNIRLRVTATQNGKKYVALLGDYALDAGVTLDLDMLDADDFIPMARSADEFDTSKSCTYTIEGAIFDGNWVELGRVDYKLIDSLNLPDTGDHSTMLLYAMLLMASVGAMAMIKRSKSRA